MEKEENIFAVRWQTEVVPKLKKLYPKFTDEELKWDAENIHKILANICKKTGKTQAEIIELCS